MSGSEERPQPFEINARSCTLWSLNRDDARSLWRPLLSFEVPIFQRPYGWGETHVKRLIGDLRAGFYGQNGRLPKEPLFIGTMQLTEMKIRQDTGLHYHEIIDGQQRLTTLLLILKVIADRQPNDPVWSALAIHDRLSTRVSSGEQQAHLAAALAMDTVNPALSSNSPNPYIQIIPLIIELLSDLAPEKESDIPEGATSTSPILDLAFIHYITRNVYFVVIETRASLAKTLQIFDAINTSGMDLNGGDIFKIRFYEYLRKNNTVGEGVFEEISSLYQLIDQKNRQRGRTVCTILDVLSLYQNLLIARHDMPVNLHRDLSASAFFDRYFDTVLRLNKWVGFNPAQCDKIVLRLDELHRLAHARFTWEDALPTLSPEAGTMLEFIWWSRYGRYQYLIVLFRDSFGQNPQQTERFVIMLAKLFICFSIEFWRMVNELHRLMHELHRKIVDPTADKSGDSIIAFLFKTTSSLKPRITTALATYEHAHNPTAKSLVCRLSAACEELSTGKLTAQEICGLIFHRRLDIEHIEPCNHKDGSKREEVWRQWGSELHEIGNLILLEETINRSLQNEDYEQVKRHAYKDESTLRIAHIQADLHTTWNIEQSRNRKKREVEKLSTYLTSA